MEPQEITNLLSELESPFRLMVLLAATTGLRRHANSRTTLGVYTQARFRAKREAQQRLVELIIPDDTQIMMKRTVPMRVWASLRREK